MIAGTRSRCGSEHLACEGFALFMEGATPLTLAAAQAYARRSALSGAA
jgi:hypothetical protein